MHIVFVTFGNFDSNATLKRATGMADPLMKKGVRVTLLLEENKANRDKIKMECPEVEVVWHQRGETAKSERNAKQKTINALCPDIVWICGVGFRNWVRKTKKNQVVLGDHSELLSSVTGMKFHRRLWEYLCEIMHIYILDGHICASKYLQELYEKRAKRLTPWRKVCVHYSPYAYSLELVSKPKTVLAALREEYGDKFIFLYMGSFRENYGFWDMLHALKELCNNRDDFTALFMGRGPEKNAGIEWIRNEKLENRIRILGYIPEEDISSYFDIADAFICPLRNTIQDVARCPSKLYMYIPFKKPIITCPIGEAYEIFGEKGVYYEPGDREGLKQSVINTLDCRYSNPIDIKDHSWEQRTVSFLRWIENFDSRNNMLHSECPK